MSANRTTAVRPPRSMTLAAVAAASVALAGSATVSRAAPIIATPGSTGGVNDVTSVAINQVIGAKTNAGTVTAVGGSGSAFPAGNSYNVTYANTLDQVVGYTAGGTQYKAADIADNVVRRYTGPNNDIIWSTGSKTGTASGSTLSATGVAVTGDHDVFNLNAINMGADNLFSTLSPAAGGNPAGNNTNVARVDMLYLGGIKSSTSTSLFIADRGNVGKHDPFAIAAITSIGLDQDGNPVPTSFGQVLKFNAFTWGNTALTGSPENLIFRVDNNAGDGKLHPADDQTEGVGGVSITTAALAGTSGQTIYGWAILDPMLNVSGNGSGTQLNDWTNESIYSHADFNNTGGGFDPAATMAVLYTAVPEPTTAAIAAMGAGSLLLGRRRKAAARVA